MSVTVRLNHLVGVTGVVAVALVAIAATVGGPTDQNEPVVGPVGTTVRPPAAAVDVLATRTPAQSSVELSRRLFDTSPVAVLAAADDPEAQRVAIASATSLGVPVLVDTPQAPAELDRLKADTVLTFGRTQTVPGARPVPATDDGAASVVAELLGDTGPAQKRSTDTIVLTRSVEANAAAVTTARIAGATVLELPDADPRAHPREAAVLAGRPDSPVIAIGTPFTHLAYTLDVVRRDIQQPTGGYLALGKHYTAMYGHPGAPQLGVLGEQGVKASVKRVERLVRKYERVSKAEFVPTFEIIATVASSSPGKDKDYSTEASIRSLAPLVDAAEKAGIYVVLDLQPGRTDFLTQAKRYRPLLARPHVGLALDPEWRLTSKQKHLVQIGSVGADEINRTSRWLADLTKQKRLPQKIFVLHQFATSMIKDRSRLDTSRPELATVIHVDGSGPQGAKQDTWRVLRQDAPPGVGWGWKNFVDEDDPMLTARQTWRQVRPHPDLVTYQ